MTTDDSPSLLAELRKGRRTTDDGPSYALDALPPSLLSQLRRAGRSESRRQTTDDAEELRLSEGLLGDQPNGPLGALLGALGLSVAPCRTRSGSRRPRPPRLVTTWRQSIRLEPPRPGKHETRKARKRRPEDREPATVALSPAGLYLNAYDSMWTGFISIREGGFVVDNAERVR